MDPILDDLTPEQTAAVTHVDGPLIVVAGPGSGKTRVISRRVAYLVDRCGVPGWKVLAITFTNKAAQEMRERIRKLLGDDARPYVATFHSFCARMLRRYGPIGRTTDYTIYDDDDQRACVRRIIDELKLDDKQWKAGAVLARISDAKSRRESAERFDAEAASFADRTVAKIYRRYEEVLAANNALDFDDLLLAMLDVLEKRDDVREELRERFKYVLVDEYQDTNRPQYEIANQLAGHDGNLVVVGDPDQSIYKWRGADLRNILEFERDHPSARVVKLEQNYRSTKKILAAAQALIANNTERREKTIFTENADGEPVRLVRCLSDDEEARLVASSVRKRIDSGEIEPAEIAVFYRTNALSRKFEEELRARGVRHVVIGAVPFFARKEVKDVLSFLRLRANPGDEVSVRRAIAFAEGFGQKTLERLSTWASAQGRTIVEAIQRVDEVADVKGAQRKAVAEFADVVRDLCMFPGEPVGPLVREVVERTGARKRLLASDDPQDWSRAENIEALVNGAFEFDGRQPADEEDLPLEMRTLRDFRGFLDHAALLASADQDRDARDVVKLMTLHSAKGLEFDEVYIAGVDAGLLPLERDLEEADVEEERRLFYVGLTRARKRVTLTSSALRRTYGQEKPHAKSRFLKELPADALSIEGGGRYGDAPPARPSGRDRAAEREFDEADSAFGDEREAGFVARGKSQSQQGRIAADASYGRAARDARATPSLGPSRPSTPGPLRGPSAQGERGQVSDSGSAPPSEAAGPIRPGDRVSHAIFGRGEVLSLQGDGVGTRVRVRFDTAGEKMLVLHYAKLARV